VPVRIRILALGAAAAAVAGALALFLGRPAPGARDAPAPRTPALRASLQTSPAPSGSARPETGSAPPPARRLKAPIVLVGLDGADWQILDPLIEAGRTPNLAALKRRSAWGHLRSYEPILSPLLWTTAVTGKAPDEHGIIDFLVPDPATGRRAPITSDRRRVRALWNIFSERDLSADVIAWWASWPAERIRGRMVSDRVAYSLFEVDEPAGRGAGLTFPGALWEDLAREVVSDADVGFERVTRFLDVSREDFDAARARAASSPAEAYREPINHLTKILASTDTYHAIALKLLREGQGDLFALYYQGIDEVCHRFAHFMPPRMSGVEENEFLRYRRAVEEFYVYQDELLGQLLGALAPESVVIVLSDHGFLSGTSRPAGGRADIEGQPGKWHRLYGVVMIAGAGVPAGLLDTATLYDVTPTVLALAGLPAAADMPGSSLLKRPGRPAASIASYEPVPGAPPAAPPPAGPAELALADEELLRNLAALGYVETGEPATPGTITAHTNLAAVLLQNGDLDGAERELRAALAKNPDYVPTLMMLGQVLARRGRTAEALELVRSAIDRSDLVEDAAYVQLALLALRAGEAERARVFLTGMLDRRPGESGVRTGLGVLAQHAGDARAAEAHFRAALAAEPTSAEALGQLFRMYRDRGAEAELEGLVRGALDRDERSVLHHNWLGLILARRGDAAGAEAEFRRALELAPDFGGSMANLGSLYGRTGRLEEAVSVLSRAVRIEPRNLEARVNLGAALAKLGRLDAAIATLEEARSLGVRSPDLLNAVGLAYAERGDPHRAAEALRESLELRPDQPDVRDLLAQVAGHS
jgi:tetratricopeptide (TPR) repeat protein